MKIGQTRNILKQPLHISCAPGHHATGSCPPDTKPPCVQVGDKDTDHNLYWGRPEQQPEKGTLNTPGWRPVWVVTNRTNSGE